jgi:hypothetical protein
VNTSATPSPVGKIHVFVDQQLGIPYSVDEQHMSDLQAQLGFLGIPALAANLKCTPSSLWTNFSPTMACRFWDTVVPGMQLNNGIGC